MSTGASTILQQAEDDRARAEERAERRKAGLDNIHYHFLKEGDEREYVVLDAPLEHVIAMREHQIWDGASKTTHYEPCPCEWEECPLCREHGESSRVMKWTVLDLTPWTSKDGKKSGNYTKGILNIKSRQIPDFLRVAEACQKANGSLRGMHFILRRDSAQDARIGKMQVLGNGSLFAFMPEEEIVAEFGHEAVIGQDGRTVIKQANADIQPFPYYEIWKEKPSAADIAQRWNLPGPAATPGDRTGTRNALADDAPVQPRAARRPLTSGSAPAAAPANPAPAVPASRVRTAPSRTASAPAAAPAAPAASGDAGSPFPEEA